MNFDLRIGTDWATQIAAIRDAVTEETHLIRFDNGFYRVCRPGLSFRVLVHPELGDVTRRVGLDFVSDTLYVTRLDGDPVEEYPMTLDQVRKDGRGIDSLVQEIAKDARAVSMAEKMVLVFYVAESLRFDHIATRVEQSIRATAGGLRGVTPELPVKDMLGWFKKWGQASEAVFARVSARARQVSLRPRATLSLDDRRFYERAELAHGDRLFDVARAIKVLKRPR